MLSSFESKMFNDWSTICPGCRTPVPSMKKLKVSSLTLISIILPFLNSSACNSG